MYSNRRIRRCGLFYLADNSPSPLSSAIDRWGIHTLLGFGLRLGAVFLGLGDSGGRGLF